VSLVDANVLSYAVNRSDERHVAARGWLDRELCAGESVGFAWQVLPALLRLTTRPGLFPRPLHPEEALEVVAGWLEAPSAVVVHPTPDHLDILPGLLSRTGTGGNLASDAHLAALALEHRATARTYDSGFGRFPNPRFAEPG
jgi:toxin-antitoxin system PIN domain toxin